MLVQWFTYICRSKPLHGTFEIIHVYKVYTVDRDWLNLCNIFLELNGSKSYKVAVASKPL